MEISQGNDPIYRSMSREFSHPEDLYRSGTAIGAYQKHQLSSERLTTHQSTCTDRAVPPSLPHQQLFQSFQVSDLPISDLLTALQQFFIHFPAEFSFHNWIVSSLFPSISFLPLYPQSSLSILASTAVESLSLSPK
jgi:hypothetical protein